MSREVTTASATAFSCWVGTSDAVPGAAAFSAGIFLPPRLWVWIYGIVLIAVGFTSACCIPFCVPLLIYWLKPEAKAYFGRPA